MQRSPFTLWLALVAVFWGVQCNSLSDDCKKTLTCGDSGAPELNTRDCKWRFPDGGVWTDGPRVEGGRWEWPNGEPAPAFECETLGAGGGASDNCTSRTPPEMGRVPCDAPFVCDEGPHNCVQCLTSTDCSNAGDAAAYSGTVCDSITHQCVACVVDQDCLGSGDTPVCFIPEVGTPPRSDITRAECVACKVDADCGGSGVCDEAIHECTLTCSVADPDRCPSTKPVCDPDKSICVECLGNGDCTPGASECNTQDGECVQCTTQGPCTPVGQVCDLELTSATYNRCVDCVVTEQCTDSAKPQCETTSRACVECLTHEQCTDVDESRCNVANHTCATCNNDNQCELASPAPHCRLGDGKCVQCTEDAHCGGVGRCDIPTGNCVECLTSAECLLAEAARCDLTLHQCDGCQTGLDCSGKNLPPLCRAGDGVCVTCEDNGDCFALSNPAASLCSISSNSGTCVPCTLDTHCDLFENFQVQGQSQDLRACKVGGANAGCVECTRPDHCVNNPNGLVCKLVDEGNGDGPQPINTCVECVDNTDCTNPAASKCEQNQCVPCTANGDCDIPGRGVCDLSGGDGECVQCTGLQRTACGSFVCDSRQRVCSTTEGVGSAVLCESCISDAHCSSTARCVEETFAGVPDNLFVCVPLQAAGVCPRGFAQPAPGTATIDQTASVCLPQTTCDARNDYLGAQTCLNATDSAACGLPNVSDGLCVQSTTGFVCTIPCDSGNDCIALCDDMGAFCQQP